MKKIGFVLFIAALFMSASAEGCTAEPTASQVTQQAALENAERFMQDVPVPVIRYFQERRTAAKWAERWDGPNKAAYVYVLQNGVIVGYYVSDGKPASNQSYLIPEESYQRFDYYYKDGSRSSTYNMTMAQAPDLDGTWGSNNPGIRFFTTSGVAVELGGNVGYMFSDAPLALNVPLLIKR